MQQELDAAAPARPIRILGLNAIGEESGNVLVCAGRSLPWLQDTSAQTVWQRWQVTWRDVIYLDGANNVLGTYNLTQHDLAVPANYAALRQMLLDAAR